MLDKGEWLPIVWFLSLVDFSYDGTEGANASGVRIMKAVLEPLNSQHKAEVHYGAL
jgi:hypothetical protein